MGFNNLRLTSSCCIYADWIGQKEGYFARMVADAGDNLVLLMLRHAVRCPVASGLARL